MAEILLNDGTPWSPSVVQMDSWKLAFKSLDVDVELAEIAAYCLNNPTKRWTRRGISNAVHANLRNKSDRAVSRASNVHDFNGSKDTRAQPKASVSGDEFRHLAAGEAIMRGMLGGVPIDVPGTFKMNITRIAQEIYADVMKDERYYADAYLHANSIASRCYGTLHVVIRRWCVW